MEKAALLIDRSIFKTCNNHSSYSESIYTACKPSQRHQWPCLDMRVCMFLFPSWRAEGSDHVSYDCSTGRIQHVMEQHSLKKWDYSMKSHSNFQMMIHCPTMKLLKNFNWFLKLFKDKNSKTAMTDKIFKKCLCWL